MSRKHQPAAYTPRQGYVDPRTHRFVSRPLGSTPDEPSLTNIQKAQAARAANSAIRHGEHQTTPEGIQRVYDIALKLGILEEPYFYDPAVGTVEAWLDLSDNTLHETVE